MNKSNQSWHTCCAKAYKHIQLVAMPNENWNNGVPSWAFVPGFVVITHCPFCGEKLPNIEEQEAET
jgi:hypothetical protein